MAARRCPICKREIPPSEGLAPLGPFCSARCRSIDLGSWLDGKYSVPVTEDDEDEGGVSRSGDQDPDDNSRIRH
jgi:endogenous inhibitor of DNA gyrase (YacG/DUF329 family)